MGKTQVENFYLGSLCSLAWEKSHPFEMLPLVSCEMMSEKQAQKFHTEDASFSRTGKCFWLVMPHGKFARTNQRHYADLGSDTSSDVILQGNQWRHHEMLAIFSQAIYSCEFEILALICLRCWCSKMLCIALLLTLILAHLFIWFWKINTNECMCYLKYTVYTEASIKLPFLMLHRVDYGKVLCSSAKELKQNSN